MLGPLIRMPPSSAIRAWTPGSGLPTDPNRNAVGGVDARHAGRLGHSVALHHRHAARVEELQDAGSDRFAFADPPYPVSRVRRLLPRARGGRPREADRPAGPLSSRTGGRWPPPRGATAGPRSLPARRAGVLAASACGPDPLPAPDLRVGAADPLIGTRDSLRARVASDGRQPVAAVTRSPCQL